jgi:hypothetical protein
MRHKNHPSWAIGIRILQLHPGNTHTKVTESGDLHLNFLMIFKGIGFELFRLSHAEGSIRETPNTKLQIPKNGGA